MSFIKRTFGVEERAVSPNSAVADPYASDGYGQDGYGKWTDGMVWQPWSTTGSKISTDHAMRLSAVFACLRLLSEAISTLPLDTYIRFSGVRKPYRPRPDYLSFQPPLQSRIEYLSQVVLSLLTDGNAYVLTPRDALGVPTRLVVLDPSVVSLRVDDGQLVYEVTVNNERYKLDPTFDLMHIKGMQLPGAIKGLSPIAYARETIGLGLAVQNFGSSFFSNGALPGAVIQVPEGKQFSQEAADRFASTWNARHEGVGNANRVGVLTGGATLSKVSVTPEDSQFLATRAFQVPDVARIFGVPPHLIADASNSTSWGSGLAEQNSAFGQFSLRPWTERIEDAHARLLTTHGMPDVFVKLNLDALLRADLQERYTSYSTGITNRFLTINEARALEDLPPVPWGDEPFVPERITETTPTPPNQPAPVPVKETP